MTRPFVAMVLFLCISCVGLADHAVIGARDGHAVIESHRRACGRLTTASRVADGATIGLGGATVAAIETGRGRALAIGTAGLAVASALAAAALGEWRGLHCEPGF